ncbi:MAG: hypothetical protein NVS3B10_31560 [Polyangiales bacterium]
MSVERLRWAPSALRHALAALTLGGALATGLSPVSFASAATAEAQERAVALYRKSQQLYKDGKFAEAAQLLREAYALSPDPVLLFNLGRACEAQQDLECAVDAYERYLSKSSPPDRAAIEARIANYRKALERKAVAEPVALPADAPERPRAVEAERSHVVPWIVTGAGGVAAFTGVVLLFVANGRHRSALAEPVQTTADEEQTSAQHTFTAGRATLLVGSAVAAIGGVWLLLDGPAERSTSALGVGFGFGAVRVTVTF